jgi:hypothetical protein
MLIHRLALIYLALGCSCSGSTPRGGDPATREAPATNLVTYEVHEWGLVRGTVDDRLMLSGTHAEPVAMPVAKPVLYFHRRGEGALVVDVEARVLNGHVVEHWPSLGAGVSDVVAWNDVVIQDGSCRTSRYPAMYDAVCLRLADGCEAATLAEVETSDSSCLYWPRPPDDDGPTASANHLFYRGEITRAPTLPLGAEVLPDGRLRLTTRGTAPIPGRVLRVRRANGAPGVSDALSVVAPPLPGASIVIGPPTGPTSAGGEALAASLREVGLTTEEINAFRRAWDETLFGHAPPATVTTIPSVTAAPQAVGPTTSILYVLPESAAGLLSTLTFSPPPSAVRRAMVVWIEETHAP